MTPTPTVEAESLELSPENKALLTANLWSDGVDRALHTMSSAALGALLDAARQEGRSPSPATGGVETGKLLDNSDLANLATVDHPDAYLNALLNYTRDLFGTLKAGGWKAAQIADCFQHIERAARGLHAKALASPPPTGEPVAWLIQSSGLESRFFATPDIYAHNAKGWIDSGWSLTPLYTSPPPAVGVTKEEVEAVLNDVVADIPPHAYDIARLKAKVASVERGAIALLALFAGAGR